MNDVIQTRVIKVKGKTSYLNQCLELLRQELRLSYKAKSSFISKGYLHNIPEENEFKFLLEHKNSDLYIIIEKNSNSLIGFQIVVRNPIDTFNDLNLTSYLHKLDISKNIYKLYSNKKVNSNLEFFLLDLIIISEKSRGKGLGKKLTNYVLNDINGKRKNKKKKKIIFMLVYPFNSYSIYVAQKLGFRLLLRNEYPPLFIYDYSGKNHWQFSGAESWVPLIYYKKGEIKKNKEYYIVLNKIKELNYGYYLASITFPEFNDYDKWIYSPPFLIDKVTGYLLSTSMLDEEHSQRKVKIFNYNDFNNISYDEYYKYGQKLQASDYESISIIISDECERIKEIKKNVPIRILDLGAGEQNWKCPSNCKIEKLDKENPIILNKLSRFLNEKSGKYDLFVAKNLFSRLFDYPCKVDYEIAHKKVLFEEIIKAAIFHNTSIIILEPTIICERELDIDKVKGYLKNVVKEKDLDYWTAFWWFALVDNFNTYQEFKEICESYRRTRTIRYEEYTSGQAGCLRKGKIIRIIPNFLILYAAYYADILGTLEDRIEEKLIPRKVLVDSAQKGDVPKEKISIMLNEYIREMRISPIQDWKWFFGVTENVGMCDIDKILIEKLDLYGFWLNKIDNEKWEKIYEHKNYLFPISLIPYYKKIFDVLTNIVRKEYQSLSDWKLCSFTIAKYIGELHGVATYSINFLLAPFVRLNENLIINMMEKLEKALLNIIESKLLGLHRTASIKSGIASIMSRNMSHNIGSHVLARLSNREIDKWMEGKRIDEIIENICQDNGKQKAEEKKKNLIYWGKDILNLLRYLQQRQDFLALVSTEWPEWTDNAYFMQDVMRWFFYQKLILSNIAASEGLDAYNYKLKNKNSIRFHVFMVPENEWELSANSVESRYVDLISRCKSDKPTKDKKGLIGCDSDTKECPNCWKVLLFSGEAGVAGRISEDIKVAVPGGLLGYHAFYIILENIIRNSAKHNYSSKEKNLDIVIEVLYDPDDKIGISLYGIKRPAYLVRIYTNVGQVDDKSILLWKKNNKKGINDYLGTPLIDETGRLRKECWGMAEMKIAAGFLQGRTIDQIGAGNTNIYGPYNESSFRELGKDESGSPYIIRAIKSPIGTLGYEFYLKKPRILGVVCPDDCYFDKTCLINDNQYGEMVNEK